MVKKCPKANTMSLIQCNEPKRTPSMGCAIFCFEKEPHTVMEVIGITFVSYYKRIMHIFLDYSDVKLMRILNSELADTLGNLLSRGCAKTVNTRQVYPKLNYQVFEEELMQLDVTQKLVKLLENLPGKLSHSFVLKIFIQ